MVLDVTRYDQEGGMLRDWGRRCFHRWREVMRIRDGGSGVGGGVV